MNQLPSGSGPGSPGLPTGLPAGSSAGSPVPHLARTRIAYRVSAFFLVISPLAVTLASKSLVIVFAVATLAMATGSWQGTRHFLGCCRGANKTALVSGLVTLCLLAVLTLTDGVRGGENTDDALQMLLMLLLLLLWPLFNARVSDTAVWFVPAFIASFVCAFLYVQLHLWLDIDLFTVFHSEDKIEALWVFNNAIVALVLFSWAFVPPASAALKPVFGLFVVLLAWVLSFFSESEAAVAGMAFGLTVYLISRFVTRKINGLTIAAIIVLLLGSPWIYAELSQVFLENVDLTKNYFGSPVVLGIRLSAALGERAELWIALQDRIFEAPALLHSLAGHGVDFLKQNHFVPANARYTTVPEGLIHPHSIFLQAWLDGGLLLVAALVSLILMLGVLISGANTHLAFAAIGLLVSATFIALVTHSLFSDWWFANLALAGIVYKVFNESLTT